MFHGRETIEILHFEGGPRRPRPRTLRICSFGGRLRLSFPDGEALVSFFMFLSGSRAESTQTLTGSVGSNARTLISSESGRKASSSRDLAAAFALKLDKIPSITPEKPYGQRTFRRGRMLKVQFAPICSSAACGSGKLLNIWKCGLGRRLLHD
jgi:hypothetical protein